MFLLGIRGRRGGAVAFYLFLTWLISLVAIAYSSRAISLSLVVFDVWVAIFGARVLLGMRETLRFNNWLSREHAFPSSPQNERPIFIVHTLIVLVFFFPCAILLIMKPEGLADVEKGFAISLLFIAGLLGVIGLSLQALRMITGR
jgi:hypothetical protein